MPQEMIDVTCPWCHKKNLLFKRSTNGIYRCSHCQRQLLSDPFVSSKQQIQASLSGDFSIRRIASISILTVSAGFGLLALIRGCSDEGQLSSLSSAPIASSSPTASPTSSSSTPELKPTLKPKPVQQRPTDDNGVPFPTKSGYLKGYPALSLGGYSSVTVDNSQNNSDVFVKLFSLYTTPPKAARVFFIRAHDTFTVKNIKSGNYDVRYRDLTSGVLSRTEQFHLQEVRTKRGFQFSRLRLTLYKVLDGNMQIQPISEGEF